MKSNLAEVLLKNAGNTLALQIKAQNQQGICVKFFTFITTISESSHVCEIFHKVCFSANVSLHSNSSSVKEVTAMPYLKHFIWIVIISLLGSCSNDLKPEDTKNPLLPKPGDEQQHPTKSTALFLLDFKNGSSRNLSSAELSSQSFYEHASGVRFSFTVPVAELSYPGIYSSTVTVTNTSGQAINLTDFPIDNAQLIISSFQAQDESGKALKGGGVANADGYKAQSNYPFLWLKTYQEVSEIPELQKPNKRILEADESISRLIDISLPQEGSQVIIALQLLAESVSSNNIPVADNGFATALLGKYGEAASIDGWAHQARLYKPSAAETCGGYLHIIENTSGIFRRYNNHHVETSNATFRTSEQLGGMDCFRTFSDQLVIADTGARQIYISSSYSPAALSEVIGSGEAKSSDGDAASASFLLPLDVASLGQHIYVADSASIRAIVELDRSFRVSTILEEQAGQIPSLTSDTIKTIYYSFISKEAPTLSGVYAFDLEHSQTKQIWANTDVGTIRWDGAAGLFVAVGQAIYHLSPGDSDWSASLAAGSSTKASIEGGKTATTAYLGQIGFFDVDKGSLYVPSSDSQQLLRIDRLR